MKVFKFGGASLASAEGITNVARIIRQFAGDKLLVVVSAIGKTTNALESIHAMRRAGRPVESAWRELKSGHMEILQSLFPKDHPIFVAIEEIFYEIKNDLEVDWEFDTGYDQIVSKGEIISSVILHHYLKQTGAATAWLDAR
ncbi:MAG: aspartate kinase, partial [Bacteroidia bacterium]|nr:aspartate kinase [Bacteroidia bacterium]